MKVAIVHDWLVNFGGAERVVQQFLKIYPQADIYTLVYDKKKMAKIFPPEKVHTSFIQKFPMATKIYTKLLSLMPKAFESFDLSSYDLVLCSSSSCAKGVITHPSVPHVAYVHTPMRYAWDLFFDYKKRSGRVTRFFMDRWMPDIRMWDFISAQRIDSVIANSNYIARRIKKFWGRDAKVIYPPVDTQRLSPNYKESEDFYVVFSRFVPYKRVDLAISACIRLKRKLVVIGSGSGEKSLKTLANGNSDIIFTGRISDEEVKNYLQRCKALIFCAEEDFGIIPVEAQACGRPVIAYGKGGALETVIDGKTGIFFDRQEEKSLADAIERFEKLGAFYDQKSVYEHAASFSEERFRKQMEQTLNEILSEFYPAGECKNGVFK
ncbi:glycosyltransferase [Treponema parvum]|uniref:Glycosyltransferase n=1 Tax=Treponema parvum TaxID=138851 RepID=A0A975EZF9_9SPIR|nr:glycosyltransferase [Treponema parvum]QTQ11765.1 glycosyltransferase [Treponema parvum]QTQ16267.1 glycosyltransferase [Treponema parvum]